MSAGKLPRLQARRGSTRYPSPPRIPVPQVPGASGDVDMADEVPNQSESLVNCLQSLPEAEEDNFHNKKLTAGSFGRASSFGQVDTAAFATLPESMKKFLNLDQSDYVPADKLEFGDYKVIGQGSIADVIVADMHQRGTVAVKIIRTAESAEDFVRELEVVTSRFKHPNIMEFIGAGTMQYEGSVLPMIVYEHASGSVHDLFLSKSQNKGWKPPSALALSWCHQLLTALSFLHNFATPFAHRDIKPANLLVSEDLQTLKLADFSCAIPIVREVDLPPIAGSPRYMAPEVIATEPYSLAKADVFSATVCCWGLVTGERPFREIAEGERVLFIYSQGMRPALPPANAPLALLLRSGWAGDGAARPSASHLAAEMEGLRRAASRSAFAGPLARSSSVEKQLRNRVKAVSRVAKVAKAWLRQTERSVLDSRLHNMTLRQSTVRERHLLEASLRSL